MYQNYQSILRLWPKGTTLLIVSLFTLALLIGSNDAIVKQSSSQSSPSSSVSVSGSSLIPQSQQRSDDSTHQQQQAAATSGTQQAAQAQPYAVSMSVSSSSSSSSSTQSSPSSQAGQASPAQSMQTGSAAMPGMRNSMGSSSNMDYSSGMNQKSYMDSMAAAASNNEQSYQAAANSVNMALANSGIFGAGSPSSASSSSGSQQNGQVGYGNSGSNMNQQQQNPAQLNPLHYFYYPSGKDTAQTQQAKPSDMMSGYQPTAASFADQLSGALAASASAPDVAASNQDPTYLPQPSGLDQFGSQQQQPQSQQNGASAHNSMQGPHQYNDYANGPQQNGPNQQQMNNQNGPSGGVSFPSSGNGNGPNDYMNLGGSSHQVNQQQQGQQQQPSNSQQSYQNLYNQLNDLSTSNFGNTGALSSPVASYLPSPSSQQQQQQQQQVSSQQQSSQMHGQQHNSADLFGSNPFAGSNLAGFNSAASQLSPSAMSPQSAGSPVGQSSGQGSSGLFGSSASLFGGSQQQSQQANSPTNSLFSNQHYLSSFMSPQQAASYASALANAGLPVMGQSADQTVAASQTSPASSASAISGSSGSSNKRFGISSFIMPMLALAGLSLLIPTMSNIGTAVGRKKRSIGEERMSSSNRQQQITHDSMNGSSQVAKENSIGEYMDKIERYYAMYKNAVESDDCMNRLICEFGDTVKDVTGKSAVVTVLERLVPNWMTGKMHLFKEAVMDNRDGKEKCKKYVCNSNKYH